MIVLRISGLVLMILFLAVGTSCSQTIEEYLGKGLEYGAQGKFEEAEKEFKKTLEIDQFYEQAEECLRLIEDVLEKRVESEVVIHLFKGGTYHDKGMIDEAIAEYKKAIAIDPNYVSAHHLLGIACHDKGMIDEAIAEYKKAIAIDPNHVSAHHNLGIAYSSKGMTDEAIAEYKKAIAIDPKDASAHNNLAVRYYMQGRYDLAVKHCDKAIELGYKVNPRFLEDLKPYRK